MDINTVCNAPPKAIMDAARTVELFFTGLGVGAWKFAGIESRDFPCPSCMEADRKLATLQQRFDELVATNEDLREQLGLSLGQ